MMIVLHRVRKLLVGGLANAFPQEKSRPRCCEEALRDISQGPAALGQQKNSHGWKRKNEGEIKAAPKGQGRWKNRVFSHRNNIAPH